MPSVSSEAERRLRDLPWHALAGLGPELAPALDTILSGTDAELVVDRFLRAHRDFDNDRRRATAQALYGVALWRRRLRAHASPRACTPLELLAVLIATLGEQPQAFTWLGLEPFPLGPTPTAWRDRCSVPDWFGAELERAVGPEAEALASALNLPGPVFLRANAARLSPPELLARLAADGIDAELQPQSPDAVRVTSIRANLTGSAAWREGLFEVQDLGSQLLGELVQAQPGDFILDACAGAGGKTLQLATLVGQQGRVDATDLDSARLERLRTRAAKAHARVGILHHGQGLKPTYDRVLVDAPCSELGALRRGPDKRWQYDPATFTALPDTQRSVLLAAAARVRPNGRLVYATCTFRSDENEAIVDAVLREVPGLQRVSRPLPSSHPAASLLEPDGTLRLFPQRHGTDGFFAVVMERSA